MLVTGMRGALHGARIRDLHPEGYRDLALIAANTVSLAALGVLPAKFHTEWL